MGILPALSFGGAQGTTIRSASELDYPPFALVTKEGLADGFAVELMRASLRAMGREVSFRVGPWHEIKKDLVQGRLDALPLVARTAERAQVYDFTFPYLSMHGAVVVRRGESRIRGAADLADKTVLVMRGDIAEEYVHDNQISKHLITTESLEQALRRLAGGEGDAMVVQGLAGRKLIRELGLDLKVVGDPLPRYQDFCFAVRSGDKALLAVLNDGLAQVIADGTYEQLRERWLGPILEEPGLPWLQFAALVAASLLFAASIARLWQRTLVQQVARRTQELGAANSRLAEEIAEREAVEADLRRHREHLESLVTERTAELQESARQKDEFLAILTHELRNPLAPISNAVELLKLEQVPNPRTQSACKMIERQTAHMVRLIDDLLDVSRITRGMMNLRKERVELAGLLEQVVEAGRYELELQGHVLSVSLPDRPVYLDADPVRLAQVFSNLLNNACKYTPQGGSIRVAADEEGTDLVVRVSDSGIGIPLEAQSRLFGLFSRVHVGHETHTSGLGIGLALSRLLVGMHGGTIEVHSPGPGQGSEFSVRLPLLAQGAAQSASPAQTAETGLAAARRILVVDDEPDIRNSLSLLLTHHGHEVATASDGLQAVELAERNRPDVILLDVGLPRLDGYGVCRRIREQPWGKCMHIVALTGWGQEEDRRKTQEAGFDSHLVKPVDFKTIQALIRGAAAAC